MKKKRNNGISAGGGRWQEQSHLRKPNWWRWVCKYEFWAICDLLLPCSGYIGVIYKSTRYIDITTSIISGLHFMSGYDIDSIKSHKIPLRLGTCQIFYTSKIPKNQFYPRKTRILQHFWPTIENGGCFTHILSVFVQLSTYKFTPVVLWKL